MARNLILADPHIDLQQEPLPRVLARYAQQPRDGPVDRIIILGDITNHSTFLPQFNHALRTWHDGDIYAIPGNHDCWWAKTPQAWCAYAEKTLGWTTPGDAPYRLIDGLLLFNWWMEPTLLPAPEPRSAFNDFYQYEVFECQPGRRMWPVPDMDEGHLDGDLIASFSHASPSAAINSAWPPNWLFVNPKVDELLRKHESRLHFFGHTHEEIDQTIDGVRYFSRPIGYGNLMSEKDLEDWVVKW